MKMMQRYILSELLRVFLLLVVVLTVMLVFVGLVREAGDRGLGGEQILKIMPFVVPSMLPFTIPATLLLAVTIVYGRMAGDLEVTAIKAAGVNPLRLLLPAYGLGFVLAIASFGLTNYATPWAVESMERIVAQAIEDIFLDLLESQHQVSRPEKGYSITVESVKDRELIKPTFRYRQADHRQVTVTAEKAKISFDLEKKEVLVRLTNPRGSVPGRDSGFAMDEKELAFPMDEEISKRNARHLTIDDIYAMMGDFKSRTIINQLQRDQEAAMLMLTGDFQQLGSEQIREYAGFEKLASHRNRKLNTEIHSRYAMAGSCLFFVFLGGPFAILQARRQFITSFIMCFLPILLMYYPVTFLMVNLVKSGSVDPSWAMWIPNLVLALVGIVVLRKVVKH